MATPRKRRVNEPQEPERRNGHARPMPSGVAIPPGLPTSIRLAIEEEATAHAGRTCVTEPPAAPWSEEQRGDAWEPSADTAPAGDPELPRQEDWPAPPDAKAYHGLAGEIVWTIDPHTEADPVAILVQTLIGYGNMIGRSAHFEAEGDKHFTNEFAVLIGRTSKGRKGSSWARVRQMLIDADTGWAEDRVVTGLSSGQGLIYHVRDPVTKKKQGIPETIDEGVSDKRLLALESEFASVLKQADSKDNVLSMVLRQAWEADVLRTLTKNDPLRATHAHVSLIGHITAEELRRYLTETEIANGLGNRFLWLCVDRSKCLPDGGNLRSEHLADLQRRLAEAVAFGRSVGTMRRNDESRELWHRAYRELSEGRPGLTGALLARAEAHVMRLACLYSLLDFCGEVKRSHLEAALALWAYCERSVRFVFGDSLGNPLADELLSLLRMNAGGITRNDIRDHFWRNRSSDEIGSALQLLRRCNLAQSISENTGGRPSERWYAVTR